MAIFDDPNWLEGQMPGSAMMNDPRVQIGPSVPLRAGGPTQLPMMQPDVRQKRSIGNVLSDFFSGERIAKNMRDPGIAAWGDMLGNIARLSRGEDPSSYQMDRVQQLLGQDQQQSEWDRITKGRNAFADLLIDPTAEEEANLARLDPGTLMEYRGQQENRDQGQRERVGQALAGVAGAENPVEAWQQIATTSGLSPEWMEKVGQALAQGIPAESLAQSFGYVLPRQGSPSSAAQNYEMYQRIMQEQGPEAAAEFGKFAIPGMNLTPAQAASAETAQGNLAISQEELDLKRRADARAAAAEERKASGAADLTPTQRGNITQKLQVLPTMQAQLNRVKELTTKMQQNGTFARGAVAGLLPGQVAGGQAEEFDKAAALLMSQIRQLTRTPGEGSMSDYESRLAAATVPSRWGSDEGRAEAIRNLETLLKGMETGYSEMLGPSTKATPRGGSSSRQAVDPARAAQLERVRAARERRGS